MTTRVRSARAKPYLYMFVFVSWAAALLWFHPRLASLLTIADSPFATAALVFFIAFTEYAWLYAFYNVGVILFAMLERRRPRTNKDLQLPSPAPAVAILYTTCNDFVEKSAASCVNQDYPDFTVYILDDSSDRVAQSQGGRLRGPASGASPSRPVVDVSGFEAVTIGPAGLKQAASREPIFALAERR